MNTANNHKVEFDKNMILYGPPGTGKTYSTAIYAVAICDKIALEDVKSRNYEEVMSRYRELLQENRIAFTTFHQSYGYEEFIEGIKPVMNVEDATSGDITYEIQSGVFKAFCERAELPPVSASNHLLAGINNSPSIWKVSLGGTGINPTRTDCLQNNYIRIGFDSYGQDITESVISKNTSLKCFINRMKIGDIILSCFSSTTIDAVGIVTGNYKWHDEYSDYNHFRKVKWVVKNIDENILAINGEYPLMGATVYKLLRIQVGDVYQIVEKYQTNTLVPTVENHENFVFIIDEINRGNISKILGELITLIEPTKRKGQPEELQVTLPYSKKRFGVPSNVYLLGTMNTADRSIALMDTALRRRFQFVEMLPDADVLRKIGADKVEDLDVARMLETINERICYLYDREHTIGHAFFTRLAQSQTVETLASIFEKSVIPLLQEYFYEDYQKIQLVLGDNRKTSNQYKSVVDEPIPTSIFKGNTGDLAFDLPEKTYFINQQAFYRLQSYKEIL